MAKKIDFVRAYGEFPSFDGIEVNHPKYQQTYAAALNWCAAALSAEELKECLISYLRDSDEIVTNLDLVPSHCFISVGKIAYIRKQGFPVSDDTLSFYAKNLQSIRSLADEIAAEKVKQDAMKLAPISPQIEIWSVGERLEDLIDANRLLGSSEAYELLTKVKSKQGLLIAIKDRFQKACDEYSQARTAFVEYFESVADAEIENRIRCYRRILDDVEAISQNKKVARKTLRRRISAEKKVSKVVYRQTDNELKIQSADPTSIIGAQCVVLYNKKRKRIINLVALDESGLTVKGTTIHGFDVNRSGAKTLRREEQQLQQFRRAERIRRVEVLFGDVRSKLFDASGRLSADTIILKTFNS